LVSADAAGWIAIVVAERGQNATLCLDPFHICQWASKALDEVRREVWNAARRGGQTAIARELKDARFALWKNPEDRAPRMRKGVWHVEVERLRAMLCQRWRMALRGRPAGGGRKPPQGASVKSRGLERCGEGAA
jgi:transposase